MFLEKNRGGLGVRSLSKMNQALLCKFGEEDGGWNTSDIRGGYDTGLWKDIRKEWRAFSQNTTFSLGNEKRLGF